MPLEATMLVLDNSEWMRNGDYLPSRWDTQTDAVNILFDAKTSTNPENMVGLMTMAGKSPQVLANLTFDIAKIFAAIHDSQLSGSVSLATGVNVASLALKHRQNKNQRQRVIAFVGSPVKDSKEDLVALAKKLKKNNVAVDIISFGEHEENEEKLAAFISTVENNENSHLLTVPVGAGALSDTLISSPIVTEASEEQSGSFQFGVDPNMDPELAMALRMSLEEEQARQRAANDNPSTAPETNTAESAAGSLVPPDAPPQAGTAGEHTDANENAQHENDMLQQALALSRGENRWIPSRSSLEQLLLA